MHLQNQECDTIIYSGLFHCDNLLPHAGGNSFTDIENSKYWEVNFLTYVFHVGNS